MDDALPASTQTKICKRLFFWQLKKSWKSIFEIEQLSKQNQYRTHSDSGSSYLGTVWELQQRSPLEQSAPQLHRWSFLPNSSRQQKVSVRDAYCHPSCSTCSLRRSCRKHCMTTTHPSPLVKSPYATFMGLMGGSYSELQGFTNRLVDRATAYGMEVSTEKSKIWLPAQTT